MKQAPSSSTGDLIKGWFGIDADSEVDRFALHLGLIMLVAGSIYMVTIDPVQRLSSVTSFALPTAPAASAVLGPDPVVAIPLAKFQHKGATNLTRKLVLHTNIPTRPRQDVITYTVQKGDTLFGISEKHGVSPETVLWGNQYLLKDDPHLLRPGQALLISPVNGVLRVVQPDDTVEGLAQAYRASPEDIINWSGNNLDSDNSVLTEGKMLVVPGGERDFIQWVIPQITRTQRNALPADAGPGACSGGYSGGAVGTGSFIWPAVNRYLSGHNYSSYHLGIDVAIGMGTPIYASDSGVAVFAGWSNWGYGNMIVIDHGNGWQTLYAHLAQWNLVCGQSVYQGGVIGLGGSTGRSSGPHLHFEMNYQGTRPNPWNYLY